MSAIRRAEDVDYYLNLRYAIMIRELTPEEGGGYVAAIPQLGIRTFVAVGDTPTEALDALDALRRFLIPQLLAEGVVLPEPRDEDEAVEQYSGKLLLRIPRSLHAQLATEAKRNGCSINQFVTQLLARNLERFNWNEQARQLMEELRSVAQAGSHSLSRRSFDAFANVPGSSQTTESRYARAA